jgi:hypothetical protein
MYHNWFEINMITKQAQRSLYRQADEARRIDAARKIRKQENKAENCLASLTPKPEPTPRTVQAEVAESVGPGDAKKISKPLLAFVRLTHGAEKEVGSEIQKLCQTEPDILECHKAAGEDCYILKIRTAEIKQLEGLLEAINVISDKTRTVTNIVLSSLKETSCIESVIE